jgi:hypothetical protein
LLTFCQVAGSRSSPTELLREKASDSIESTFSPFTACEEEEKTNW